tara:strand:+ start:7449 stop:8324 length:876 start_codon:yes stop_codon:yes gene_type:complete
MSGQEIDYEALKADLEETLGDKMGSEIRKVMETMNVDAQVALIVLGKDNKLDFPTKTMESGTEFMSVDAIHNLVVDPEKSKWVETIGLVTEVSDVRGYPKDAPRDKMLPFVIKGLNSRVPCVIWKEEGIDNVIAQLDDGGIRVGHVYRFSSCTVGVDTWRNMNSLNMHKNTQVEEAEFDDLYGGNGDKVIEEAKEVKEEPKEEKKEAPKKAAPAKKAAPKKEAPKKEPASTAILDRCKGIMKAMQTVEDSNVQNVSKAMGVEEDDLRTSLKTMVESGEVELKDGVFTWSKE